MSYLTVVWGMVLGYFFFSEVQPPPPLGRPPPPSRSSQTFACDLSSACHPVGSSGSSCHDAQLCIPQRRRRMVHTAAVSHHNSPHRVATHLNTLISSHLEPCIMQQALCVGGCTSCDDEPGSHLGFLAKSRTQRQLLQAFHHCISHRAIRSRVLCIPLLLWVAADSRALGAAGCCSGMQHNYAVGLG